MHPERLPAQVHRLCRGVFLRCAEPEHARFRKFRAGLSAAALETQPERDRGRHGRQLQGGHRLSSDGEPASRRGDPHSDLLFARPEIPERGGRTGLCQQRYRSERDARQEWIHFHGERSQHDLAAAGRRRPQRLVVRLADAADVRRVVHVRRAGRDFGRLRARLVQRNPHQGQPLGAGFAVVVQRFVPPEFQGFEHRACGRRVQTPAGSVAACGLRLQRFDGPGR